MVRFVRWCLKATAMGAAILPRTALAGWGDENWGEMVWGPTLSVPTLGLLGLSILVLALASAAAWGLRRRAWGMSVLLVVLAIPLAVAAGTVAVPNTFSNGTTADADDVNANFDAVETAVNDNDSRILGVESDAAVAQITADTAVTDAAAAQSTADTAATALATEATARTAADVSLQSAIDAETASRSSADTALQIGVDSEAASRASADTSHDSGIAANETAISDGTTARMAADAAQDTAIAVEIALRASGDGALDTRLGAVESGTFSSGINVTNAKDIVLRDNDGVDAGDIVFLDDAASQIARIWSGPGGTGLNLSSTDNDPDIEIDSEGDVTMTRNLDVSGELTVAGTGTASGGFAAGSREIPADIWSSAATWVQGSEGSVGTQGNYGLGLYQNGYRGGGGTFTLMGVGPPDESWNQEEMNALELDRAGFSFFSTDYGNTGGFPRTGLAKPDIRMRIAPNGNVGIGGAYTDDWSVQPGSRLEVVGGDIDVDGDVIFGPSNTSLTVALASAGGGVAEINQDCAVNTGCFAGDSAGFPVTITSAGSYRLTSNLIVSGYGTNMVQVEANDVAINLGGFAIIGPNICTGNINGRVEGCSAPGGATGTGIGPTTSVRGTSIKNGVVMGMGGSGISVRSGEVINVTARWNGSLGIIATEGSLVSGSRSRENGSAGFSLHDGSSSKGNVAYRNYGDGFTIKNSSSSWGDTAYKNGQGFFCTNGSSVASAQANQNTYAGITIYSDCLYRDSFFRYNGSENVQINGSNGIGMNAGGNVCFDGSVSTCP